jgi:site-specific recombinase XerD
MKALSPDAHVDRSKIFPHNLRHFFAVNYYRTEKDIVRLADLLGHTSINTTRIYTLISCESQLDILDKVEKSLEAV